MRHWLIKSEPTSFSWDDLWKLPERTTSWEGVRNHQARNFLREMRVGDLAFFYHSSAEPNAIIGIAEIVREAYPDPTQFDAKDDHHDPKSTRESPTWMTVDVRAREPLARPVALAELRTARGLDKMELLRKGSRLSVTPVSPAEWAVVCKLALTAGGRR
jgi:predicted RNA-binding protein with PUA-like domain